MIRIKLNPVLENEMKRNMRSIKRSWVIFIVNVILTVVALLTYFGTVGQQDFLTSGQYRFPVQYYVMMAYALFLMICILVPGIAGGSIAIERDRRTLDLLLTTHLSPWKVVIGKLESSLSFIFLVAFSALPVMALILVFGGVSFVDLFALVGILVISGIFIGSVGIFCSAVIRKTTVATIASYVIVVLLTLGILILLTGSHYILNVRAEQMGNFEGVDIGKWVYLLYLNPLVIYFGLLSNQVGSGCELLQICSRFGEYTNDFGVVHMLGIAVGVQLLISMLLLYLAGKSINPFRK